MVRIVLLVGDNQRQERHGLARPRWHLQHAVPAQVERAWSAVPAGGRPTLEITHVSGEQQHGDRAGGSRDPRILLGVYAWIWKEDRKVAGQW